MRARHRCTSVYTDEYESKGSMSTRTISRVLIGWCAEELRKKRLVTNLLSSLKQLVSDGEESIQLVPADLFLCECLK